VWVFWYAGGVGVTVTTADEQAVIDSIRFVDQLPTP
jgi:hypothetical protein